MDNGNLCLLKKIKQTLIDICGDSDFETFDLLNDSIETKRRKLQEMGGAYNITRFRDKYPDLNVTTKNYVFQNGLEFTYIEYAFNNRKGYPSVQRDITGFYQSQKFICVLFQSKRGDYLNVLRDMNDSQLSLPVGEKQIEISKVNVLVNSNSGSAFTSYYNLADHTLIQEVYSSGCEIGKASHHFDSSLVPFDDYDQIMIRYQNEKPVSMQLESDFSLDDFEYDSNSLEDVSEVVEGIQKDVDSICEKIKIYQSTMAGGTPQKKIGMK